MVICPRRNEGTAIRRDDGSVIDFVALNGTLLAGTMMVKNEELWHVLQNQPEKLAEVFHAIGLPVDSISRSFTDDDFDDRHFPELKRGRPAYSL